MPLLPPPRLPHYTLSKPHIHPYTFPTFHPTDLAQLHPLKPAQPPFHPSTLQIWLNCTLYNPPNHPVRVAGDAMSDLWEKSWLESGVEAAWRDFELRYSGGAATAAAEPASRRGSYGGAVEGGVSA